MPLQVLKKALMLLYPSRGVQFEPGLECSVEAYGKLLSVRGEQRLMGVWKEMGWDGMDMQLAEKIYKRKVCALSCMPLTLLWCLSSR